MNRRLFRSGESEYLLNGKLCRLRDIQELFMGTGLGPESYALIEQGRIGQILSSRPTDRRAIIEEAAGITKFKTKKRLAEARLEDAKINLARVNDIFEEVTRQMNSLKRQASKAERYAKLREEMRAKLRLVLASKFAQLELESAALDAQIRAISEEMRLQAETVQQSESEHGERTQRGYAIETEVRENRERLSQLKLDPTALSPSVVITRNAVRNWWSVPPRSRPSLPRPNSGWPRWRRNAMAIARFWTRQRATWPPRSRNCPKASTKRQRQRRLWRNSNISRNNRGS